MYITLLILGYIIPVIISFFTVRISYSKKGCYYGKPDVNPSWFQLILILTPIYNIVFVIMVWSNPDTMPYNNEIIEEIKNKRMYRSRYRRIYKKIPKIPRLLLKPKSNNNEKK